MLSILDLCMDHLISPSKLQRNIVQLFIISCPAVPLWPHRWPLKSAISSPRQSHPALSISMSWWSKCTLVWLLRVVSHRWPLKAATLGPNTAKQSRSTLSTCMSWCSMVSLLMMVVVVLVSPVSHYDPTGGHQRPPPPRTRAPPGSRAQIVAKRTSRDLVLLLCKVILSKHRFSRELRTCFQQWPDPGVAIDVEVIHSGVSALAALQVVVAASPYLGRQWYMSAVVSRLCPRLWQATWYGLTWGQNQDCGDDDDYGGADENYHWLSLTSWNSIFGQFLANKVNTARPLQSEQQQQLNCVFMDFWE